MATLYRREKRIINTDHDTDRSTIRAIRAMLVARGLCPEFCIDNKSTLMVKSRSSTWPESATNHLRRSKNHPIYQLIQVGSLAR